MATDKAKSSAHAACSATLFELALSTYTVAKEKHLAVMLLLTSSYANEGWEMSLTASSCMGIAAPRPCRPPARSMGLPLVRGWELPLRGDSGVCTAPP